LYVVVGDFFTVLT